MNFHERQHGLEILDLIYVSKEEAICLPLVICFPVFPNVGDQVCFTDWPYL